MSCRGFNPSSFFPKTAVKTQAMGETVSASRLLITACLQTWKTELKTLGNPNLNISRPDLVLLYPRSSCLHLHRNLPWWFGRALQPCCAGANGCWGAVMMNQTLCTPAKVNAIAAAGDGAEKAVPYVTSFHRPFAAISESWLLGWGSFTLFLYSWLERFGGFFTFFFFFFLSEMKNHLNLYFSRGDFTNRFLNITWKFSKHFISALKETPMDPIVWHLVSFQNSNWI